MPACFAEICAEVGEPRSGDQRNCEPETGFQAPETGSIAPNIVFRNTC